MPIQFGSDDYIWDIVSNFLQGALPPSYDDDTWGGILGGTGMIQDYVGTGEGWSDGFNPDTGWPINYINVDGWVSGNQVGTWATSAFSNPAAGVDNLQVQNYLSGSGGWGAPGVINMSDWVTDWGLYLPSFNPQDLTDIRTKQAHDKAENIWETLSKAYSAENRISNRILQGGDTHADFIYQSALATGRLSDFETTAQIQGVQNQFDNDLFNAIGDIAELGAFDWSDEWNVDYFQTIVQADSSMPICDQQCEAACQNFINYNPDLNIGGIEDAQAQCQNCLDNCVGV